MSEIRNQHKAERRQRAIDENYEVPIWKTGIRNLPLREKNLKVFIPGDPPLVTAPQSRPRVIKEPGSKVPVKIVRVSIKPSNEVMNIRLNLEQP